MLSIEINHYKILALRRQERLGLGHTKDNLLIICLISALLNEN